MLGIDDSVFASCCIELRGFAAKIPPDRGNDRRKTSPLAIRVAFSSLHSVY